MDKESEQRSFNENRRIDWSYLKMNDKIDFLMIFPKYRRLINRLKTTNRDNRNLRKNWQTQIAENELLKEKLKKHKELIEDLRKEIKELRK